LLIAAKVLEIGESILHGSDGDKESRAHIAAVWLQKALLITEKAKEGNDDLRAVPGAIDLKVRRFEHFWLTPKPLLDFS
jgi:hypothetical protein